MENKENYGLKLTNTYAELSPIMYSHINPIAVKNPELVIFNNKLSEELGLDFTNQKNKQLSEIFSGNIKLKGTYFISQAYAGHQFGHFTILGDGRASLMGEQKTPDNKLVDIQFKGSGRTPYSRGGDGRATLGSMLREYIISEAMYHLNIPTTRSLAVVKTGEDIIREKILKGAILTRVASSHIRVGTFQYLAMNAEKDKILDLVNFSINRHYQYYNNEKNKPILLLESVMENQIKLIINWMRVGFIHGVMNTDNMTISGETIDYGPCAFIDTYNPNAVFSSIDQNGRYSFINQSIIAQWNLARFAETLIPLIDEDEKKSLSIATDIINNFKTIYKKKWLEMMGYKIGISNIIFEDEKLISDLLNWMEKNKADYTNTFNYLQNISYIKTDKYNNNEFKDWLLRWHKRLNFNGILPKISIDLMKENNPIYIPRNYKIEEILKEASENNNFKPFNEFLEVLQNPYILKENYLDYLRPSPYEYEQTYKTFCGT